MNARETVLDYYEALRRGEPLAPFFAAGPDVVKVGVFSRRTGGDHIADGLRAQTQQTTDWTVDSHDLVVRERAEHAWFADRVDMAWVDSTAGRYDFETRWSGVLEPTPRDDWQFVEMHVSAPHPRHPETDEPADENAA